jgi:sulfate adenylyltransferase
MEGLQRLSSVAQIATPYGGILKNLQAAPKRVAELKAAARDFTSLDLSPRQLCDLELLANGSFSPLAGFMGRQDYESVCERMRLADETLWPVPITLDVPLKFATSLVLGQMIALRDFEGTMIAALKVSEIWEPNKNIEAEALYGTSQRTHPEAEYLIHKTGEAYISGTLEIVEQPTHHDFTSLRATPKSLRTAFLKNSVRRVIAFQTHKLMHRAHVEFTHRVAQSHEAELLINGVVGRRNITDTSHFALVRAWRAVLDRFQGVDVQLNLLELAPRMCGPRAPLWHAIINRNHGCTHFVVEHDYASFSETANGEPLYGQYQAAEFVMSHEPELGIKIVPFRDLIYEEDRPEQLYTGQMSNRRIPVVEESNYAKENSPVIETIKWFSYDSVLRELRKACPPRRKQGFTVFFTGLSGSGKSTIAQVLHAKLLEFGDRPVTMLDGDVVRKHLSSELGFSREHRDINVCRLGYVSSLIAQNRGIAICAPIAPYAQTRAQVRAMIEPYGGFIEVHIATPLEVCESRDRKGLYARARAGLIKEFTGISDPYEPPIAAEVVIDTTQCTAYQAADQIIGYLQKTGFLPRRFQAVTKVAARLPQATVDMRVLNVQSPSAAESLGTTKKYKIIHNS